MKKIKTIILFAVFAACFRPAISQNIYQWRGPNRDGVYRENKLLDQWSPRGPEMLWFTQELGAGFAAPCVTNNKLFINGVTGTDSYIFCFDLNGKLLWKSPNGKEFTGSGYASGFPGARSTPTVVGDLVYVTSGLGRIACLDVSNGKEKWAVDMVKDLKGYLNEFGYAESVVTDDNAVYCFPGGKDLNMAALDRLTGKIIWTSKATGDTTHFCSPILVNHSGRKMVVSVSRHYIFAVDCKNGELLWKYGIAYKYDGDHVNTPVYKAPYLYFVSGDENGKGAIKLELQADGKSVKEIWTNDKVRNSFSGFIVDGNKLFVTTENKNLNVLETVKGTVTEKIRAGYGGIIYAADKFIVYGNNGEVTLINYAGGKLSPGGSFKIEKGTKEHFAHPVVADGILYIRHGNALMAFKIK